jgi:hypothetical protein
MIRKTKTKPGTRRDREHNRLPKDTKNKIIVVVVGSIELILKLLALLLLPLSMQASMLPVAQDIVQLLIGISILSQSSC